MNGAGKTTQLQIVMGRLQPDEGQVIKARKAMRIAYLAQVFDVLPTRTVREEFYSVYQEQLNVGAGLWGGAGGVGGQSCTYSISR